MPAYDAGDLYNFLAGSPEFDSAINNAANTRSSVRGNSIPGGKLVQDLFQGNNVINNRALDVVGGAGQYKLPQRLIAALAGSYALGDENEPLSISGAGLGYGAAAGADEAVRMLRDRNLTETIKGMEASKGLINVDEDYILKQLQDIGEDIKAKNLPGAIDKHLPLDFNLSATPGSSYRMHTPSGYGDLRGYYSGDLLDEDVLSNLRGKIKTQLRGVKDIPGYSGREHMNRLNSLLDEVNASRKEYSNIGITAQSLRESGLDKLIKAHELAEMSSLGGLDGARAPMSGGVYNRRGAADIGSLGIIANHASPAVPLRESNLQARVAPMQAQNLNKRFQAILGEDKFFNKILGADLGDVILSDKYIAENSDDIANILQKYVSKGSVPEKALLDKVRVNPIISSLGRAGRSVKTFEHGLIDAIKTLIWRRK